MFDMGRQFDQRTAASMFGIARRCARKISASIDVYLFAANLEAGVEQGKVVLKQRASSSALRA